jgi:ABC-type polysaccharide/polyol phosphate transport system ATPase subunit
MSSKPIIELRNIWKKYSTHDVLHRSLRHDIVNVFTKSEDRLRSMGKDEFWALRNVDMSVHKGEIIGLYGPNGAGKSTLLKLIAHVTYPTRGDVFVEGRVAPMIEIGAGFHQDLTGRENIYVNGTILGMKIREITRMIPEIIEFSGMQRFMDMSVKKYSSGMYLRLGFSVAIHSSAEVLLIDEIIGVGDEDFQKKCLEKLLNLRTEGRSIVIVSHSRELLHKLADRVLLFKEGLLVDSGL